jgi:hypothetical protein
MRSRILTGLIFTVILSAGIPAGGISGEVPRFAVELEGGAVWQSRNDIQIPNDETGTRFSLVDVIGKGPWPAGRLYFTWNINDRHGLRALLAPLSITDTGEISEPVDFAGESYEPGTVEATYKFNSWRLSYRYRFLRREDLSLWVGFTAKMRDAKIELSQGSTTSKDTDVGFVPLLHLAADWRFVPSWHLLFDFDGLAGGPGRAFDIALKLGYDINEKWGLTGGYRMIEGGADVESVYNFAWLHYAVVSVQYRF